MIHRQNSSTLFYERKGNGRKTLLLFHGFGQDHATFNPLMEQLKDEYTFYSFDLYFHGKSNWTNGEVPLEKHEWKNIINAFLKENSIEEFALLGFSLGGK